MSRMLCRCAIALAGLLGCVVTPRPATTPPAPRPKPAVAESPPAEPGPPPVIDAVLEEAFLADSILAPYVKEAARRRLQVLVTLPTIDPNGERALRRFVYRVDAEYYYPASAIKVLLAASAVEKLEELRGHPGGGALTLKTPVRYVEGEGHRRRALETTLDSDLERALVVSDNEASNRLFDFVGREELAARLKRVGLQETRIVHPLGDVRERDAPPVIELFPGKGRSSSLPVAQLFGEPLPENTTSIVIGNTHMESGHVVAEPMDFSNKNAVPLRELQDFLIALMRPDLVTGETLRITKDRKRLLDLLGTLPSGLRGMSGQKKLDALYKPLHHAILQTLPRDHIRVYGKSGRAFGFLVENSYAINDTTKRSMFVTATIYANDSERMNDDRYEYSAIAAPFVARLGRVLARAFLAGS
jgi:hypothetical protein